MFDEILRAKFITRCGVGRAWKGLLDVAAAVCMGLRRARDRCGMAWELASDPTAGPDLPHSLYWSDNGRVYIPRALAHQSQFFAAVAQVRFPPGVASVTPTLGTDWNGESAVFFQVVIDDHSVPRSELLALTKQISHTIVQQIRPLEEWGVLPYFSFLTQSENARVKEPSWA